MSILSVSSPITSTRKHKQVTTPTVSRFLLASAMASTNPFLKVARQHETTKTHLHKRVSNVPFQFKDIFPQDVVLFLRHKAVSVNSSIGYLTPALLTTAAFLTAKNGCTVETITHEQPVNIYMMFVGYPGTGKSSAIEDGCLQTIKDLFRDQHSCKDIVGQDDILWFGQALRNKPMWIFSLSWGIRCPQQVT